MKSIFSLFFIFFKSRVLLFFITFLLSEVTAKAQYTFFDFATESPLFPDDVRDNAGVALEVGVKFRFNQTGIIKGVYWYQTASNETAHTVNLWLNDGTNLATATSTVAGTGWRYIEFAAPVTVNTTTTYVASVHMPNGFYSGTPSPCGGPPNSICWLTQQTRGFFIALATADGNAAPGNGAYIESPTSAFPNLTNLAINYWVDVEFTPTFPLPVNLSDFKAATTNNDVVVSWKTESEQNNRGFEIQRSNNNVDWYAVSFVNGAGESITTKNYSYSDKGLAPGLYYYRLKQIDNDGKFKNSAVVTATVSGKGRVLLFQNSPNPFRGAATIRFDLPNAQRVKLSILDILGREVKVLTNKVSEAGSHIIPVDGTGLSRQLYYIRLQTENGTLTRNMLVE